MCRVLDYIFPAGIVDYRYCDLMNIHVNTLCRVQAAAGNIINMLWQLMENGLEELKLLQTVLVLLTTNTVVHDEVLSKVPESPAPPSSVCAHVFLLPT